MAKIDVQTADIALIDRLVALALDLQKPEEAPCLECGGEGTTTYYHYGWIEEGAQCKSCNGECYVPTPAGYRWWYKYCTDFYFGSKLIQDEKIMVQPHLPDGVYHGRWRAVRYAWDGDFHVDVLGDSMLEAAMRAFVASRLDYEFEVPDELLLEVSSVKGGSKPA